MDSNGEKPQWLAATLLPAGRRIAPAELPSKLKVGLPEGVTAFVEMRYKQWDGRRGVWHDSMGKYMKCVYPLDQKEPFRSCNEVEVAKLLRSGLGYEAFFLTTFNGRRGGKMGKRGNGEGGISRRKDGLYMARYTIQTPTGPKRKTLYGKTRREVDEKLTKAKADRDGGLVFDADNLRLGEYLERWLVDSVRDTVRATTFERYEQIVRLHIRPVLGKVKLKNLTPAHVRGLYRQKLDGGLSPRSVQYVHVTLHKALKQAIADGLIPRNATEAVKPPQVSREEMRPLTSEQVKVLFEAAKGDRLEALYVLGVTTGLRQGELLGLKWDDIDLEVGTLQVRRTLTTAKGGPVLSAPKTKGSRRTVRLSQTALEALRCHLERQLEEIDQAGGLWRENGLIFASEAGEPLDRRYITTHRFKPLLKRTKLPQIRFHDLRHTCATLLLSKNVNPKVVSEMLGHASIAITLDTYSHVLPNMQESAAKAMEEALS